MINVGDKVTFYYVTKHWIDDDGNPVDCDSGEEWEEHELDGARAYAKACPKGETACIIEAHHTIKEVYHG